MREAESELSLGNAGSVGGAEHGLYLAGQWCDVIWGMLGVVGSLSSQWLSTSLSWCEAC